MTLLYMKYYTYICPHYTYPLNRFVMKLKLILASVMLIGLTFSGCEKIKSLLDVHFNTHYTVDMNLSVPVPGSVGNVASTFQGSATINPKDNAEVAKYGKLIKGFDISSATGTFKNVSKAMTLVSAELSITSGNQTASWQFSNLSITNGTHITFDNSNGQWDKVNAILGSLEPFTVTLSGETDKDGVSFTMTLAIDATVTANPLSSK